MDFKWLAEQVALGRTDKDIASECGDPVHMVAYHRRTKLGVVREPHRTKWGVTAEWLAERVAAGKSDKEIAAERGMTVSAVGQNRRRFKIAPRPRSVRAREAFLMRYPNGRMGEAAGNWRGGRTHTGSGYIRLYMPDHPHANQNGYVYEHRYVMEQKLGRLLKPGELVDHIDRKRSNNAPENLRLQASRSEHVKDHFAARDQLIGAQARIAELEAEIAQVRHTLQEEEERGDAYQRLLLKQKVN